ncbi:MAG: glycosyltransferase [Endomicrobium sp.]|jgi:glycosyltransferase involved in cell wall biosynthesis|nr:glycosyltransferase [Endomicrobium sp.]
MKIGFCVDKTVTGGSERILLGIIDKLLEDGGYEIALFAHYTNSEKYFADYFQKNNIPITQLKFPQSRPKGFFQKLKWRLARRRWNKLNASSIAAELNKCDVLIDFKNGVCYNSIKNIKNKIKILWLHTSFEFVRDVVAKNCDIKSYNKVVCVSKKLRESLIKAELSSPQKTLCVYNHNFMNFDDIAQKSKIPLNIDDKYFLSVSRLDKGKDITTLIRAYAKFAQRTNSPVKLYIIGDGPLAEKFKREAGTLLDTKIKFLGAINEPYNYMRNCEAFILSSQSEGFGLVLLEAMISQTLTVSSNCPISPAEILQNGKSGVLFETGNFEELSGILTRITDGTIDKKTIIENACKSLTRYSGVNFGADLKRLFKKDN